MKRNWIIFLVVIVVVALLIIGIVIKQQNSKKVENENLCDKFISLAEIKNTCNTQIQEDVNSPYYITPNNTTIDSVGNQAELSEGELSRCFKRIFTNDYDFMSNKGSGLTIVISVFDSSESANKNYEETVPSFNESNSWEKTSKNALVFSENTSEFGTRGNIASYRAMDAFIPEENMTTHLSKAVGISFLKGNKVIWIQSDSYNQTIPLLCELENLKQVAAIIDKKIN